MGDSRGGEEGVLETEKGISYWFDGNQVFLQVLNSKSPSYGSPNNGPGSTKYTPDLTEIETLQCPIPLYSEGNKVLTDVLSLHLTEKNH